MEPVVCPVCHQFVGHAPDGWDAHVIHRPAGNHSMVAERPRPPYYPNPD